MNKFLLLIIIPSFAFAQQKQTSLNLWHLTVVDSVTAKGIDRVTVSINKKRYYTTDVNGVIDINRSLINQDDNIIFSCIGYKSNVIVPGINHRFPDTIKLLASVRSLKEVKISLLKPMETTIGDIKKSYNSHRVPNPEEEFVQYIPNNKKITGIITSIEYVLNDELHGIEMPFKVGLYTKSKKSIFPDEELIKDSIIVYNPQKKRQLSVDISRYNIQLPEDGVIVTFETLSPKYYGKDSIWYKGRNHLKMPGIDMDLKEKDSYPTDFEKHDRKGPYSMVINVNDKWSSEEVKFHSYIFTEGNNLAITLTVSQ
jgi:hypothetical protein